MKIELEDLKKLSKSRIYGDSKSGRISFTGVSIDSRNCRKSDLFFAVKGQKNDGHDFVKAVFKTGVKAAVVNKKWFKKLNADNKKFFNKYLLVTVNDTVISLGELASIHRTKFLLPVLAVGGSNGKTTAKEFIAHVLSKKFNVLKTEGNYNNEFGVPLTLFRLNEKHDIAVIEVGANHFGEITYLCGIAKPQFGIITNIGKEHLEFFKNLKGAGRAECELIDYLYANYGTFFLNKDEKFLIDKVKKLSIKHFTFGKSGKPDVKGKLKFIERFNPIIKISYGKERFTAKLKSIGTQSFEAALCASAAGFYFGVASSNIKKALVEIELGKSKRNNLIRTGDLWIIDDTYNSNPDSVKTALENLKHFKVKGKKHIVLADMLELGRVSRKEHTESGKLVKKLGFENLYTYGDEAYNIFKGAKGLKNNYYFSEKQTLIEFLKLNIKKNDIVLVKGSRAMKMEEIVHQLIKGEKDYR
jgi:UDP-N-acetylmuramoyl-tripeptide--D-alanyl-D-alanine ligase